MFFLRCIVAGFLAALVGALVSWLFDLGMDLVGFSFVPFGIGGHIFVVGFLNIVGILPLFLIGRFVGQPVTAYFTLALVFAVCFSILVGVAPPWKSEFSLLVAIPAFLVVTLASATVATQVAYSGLKSSEPVSA